MSEHLDPFIPATETTILEQQWAIIYIIKNKNITSLCAIKNTKCDCTSKYGIIFFFALTILNILALTSADNTADTGAEKHAEKIKKHDLHE
jgi:hypothetical protein